MKSEPRDLAAGAALVLVALLAFSPWWAAGRLLAPLDVLNEMYVPWNQGRATPEVHNHFTSDAVTQYLVYRRVAERSFAEDGDVGWSDLTGGGRPEYANTMATPGDWTVQLHRVLPFWTAWHLGLVAHFVVAALGMLVFLRSRGTGRGIALVGAAAYAANTQFVLWIHHRWQLGAFAWVPWLAWALLTHRPGRRRTWVLAPAFLALALLGGNLQTAAITLLAVPALWVGMGREGAEVGGAGPGGARIPRPALLLLAWTALGVALAAFALVPGALALLETTGESGERVRLGYPGGILEPLRSALFIALQALPSWLGSPRSVDLAKALGRDLADVAFFGFVPVVIAVRAVLLRRRHPQGNAPPSAARRLVALGLLLPLTPLVGLFYHRVQLLFVFGGVWAFAWYWENVRDDPFVTWLWRAVAVVLGVWLAGSALTLLLEPRLTEAVQGVVAARIAAGSAGVAGNAYPDWMLERAARLLPELRIWHPRQLAVVLAVAGSMAALRLRGRPWAVPLLGACVALELGTFAAGWVTFADPARHPPYPLTSDLAAVRERVGDGRVFVRDGTGVLFPPNTLAWYGIATIQEYESVEVRGMWQEAGSPTDAAALARFGVSHALSRPGDPPGSGWTREHEGGGFVLWRNDHPAPRYAADGGGAVRALEATANRRRLEVAPGASRVRVAENWAEGWRYRVGGGPWRAAERAPDGSLLLALPAAVTEGGSADLVVVEMRYAPVRRAVGRWISATALLALLGFALVRSRFAPRLAATAVVILALLAAPARGASQATPYVPPLDPAYRDLDALVAAGLVRGLVLGQGPHSRLTFARAATEARTRLDGGGRPPTPRLAEALARLESGFAAERALICEGGEGACPRAERYLHPRRIGVDVAAAEAPRRAIPTLYSDGPDYIDADVRPFLQSAQGRAMADEGWTLGGEGEVDVGLGRRVAGQLAPRFWALDDAGAGAEADGTLLLGYLRAVLGNLAVDVGRFHGPVGPARVYGPVISHNARALDQVRLSTEESVRLPWIFGALGPTRMALWVADMGRNRDIPGSKLIGLQGAIRPHANLELGGSLLNLQFGEGAPSATWGRRIRDFFFMESRRFLPFQKQGEFSDKVLAADARLDLPRWGTKLHLGFMTTDDHNLFDSPGDGLWNNAAWTGGVEVSGIGAEGRTDVWLEWTRSGVRAYTHHQFTSGMSLDRRVMGSPVGPLGTGVQGGLTWNGSIQTLELAAARERYAGDLYREDPETRQWIRIADNPDEIRLRATLDWERRGAATGLRTTARLGYEHVTRFDFTDRNRSNLFAQVGVGWIW